MAADSGDWRELNRRWWDERVPLHVESELYDIEGFRAGKEQLRDFELRLAGDVSGLRLAHLQCHFGQDSIAWARHGASVVGLDFSQPAVDAANGFAHELDVDARFVCADVYDAVAALGGERFDLVYTGLGAINWLPDLEGWSNVVAALVKPGGRLLLAEFHPFSHVFADEGRTVEYPYFSDEPFVWHDAGSYADPDAETAHNSTIEHQHTVAEVLTCLLARGLRITAFEEFDYTLFPRFPDVVADDRGFVLPPDEPSIPLMFALVAELPE